jgi:hypothetical protein
MQAASWADGSVWCIRDVHLACHTALLAFVGILAPPVPLATAFVAMRCADSFVRLCERCVALQPLHPVLARVLLAATDAVSSAMQVVAGHVMGSPAGVTGQGNFENQAAAAAARGLPIAKPNLESMGARRKLEAMRVVREMVRSVVQGVQGSEAAPLLFLIQ